MARVGKAAHYRPIASRRNHDRAAQTVLAISGVLFTLLGAVLAIGGYLSVNGSAFHMFVGLGLIVSGLLFSGHHRAGVWTYMVVFAATVSWSLRNVDGGSPLQVRLIGPFILLVMIAVLMPLLFRWQPRHTIAAFSLLLAATLGLGISSLPKGPLASQAAAVTQFLDAETKGILQ